MRTQNDKRRPQGRDEASSNADLAVRDFEQIAERQDQLVEHQTIPGFLRRIPHKWHMDEINRFGDKVGRTAESMQLAYLTVVDRSLGVIRVFPVPLMQRIYTLLAPQFAWPPIPDSSLMATREAEAIRANERARRHLRAAAEHATEPAVAQALSVVMEWLDREARADGAPAEPPPLRAL